MDDERSRGEGPRYQPEFSLGERMATMEATLKSLVESTRDALEAQSGLFVEKIDGVRAEMVTKDTAQKEATNKAEQAAGAAATALATELRTQREASDARLGALERGAGAGSGEKVGSGELANREQVSAAQRTAQKAVSVAIAVGALSAVAIIVALINALH